MMVDVSVIVISWNTRALLEQCLRSVYGTAGDLVVEVIVVDNGSTDGSVEMVRERFPQARLMVNRENVGFARANNQAMAVAQGRYFLLLNSDAVLRPGALKAMVDLMGADPRVGIAGGRLMNPDGSFQASFMDFPTLWAEILLMIKLHPLLRSPYFPSYPPAESEEVREADWVPGACMLVRREVWKEVGGLDETYFMYSEEVDWCWRVGRAGWRIYYTPEAEIVHWGGQSIGQVPLERRARVYRGKWLFFHRRGGRRTAGLFRLALVATTALKMGLWALLMAAPVRAVRDRARRNLRSYRRLLSAVGKGAG
ncbi:MAG TPA: glycosyltransferase family 2 protein [Anaerolineae bacterium]|nr:glycosyltransferase family 2 protein [Anaerolineae bacterium]